ncbi:hypothetical protein [Acidisoma silvae]|uniref:Uncharacterized protein n=1 Tax=Acidisoma silvae TaxID=2802396 RepID=A0A963YU78_9PROT|nr:hypothetical protein [Acidisoma silvae]MCB8876657.1 hypothetical protein [Acidisoma silvae]
MSDFVQAARADYLAADDIDRVTSGSGGRMRRLAGVFGKLAAFLLVTGCLLYPVMAIGFSVYLRVL